MTIIGLAPKEPNDPNNQEVSYKVLYPLSTLTFFVFFLVIGVGCWKGLGCNKLWNYSNGIRTQKNNKTITQTHNKRENLDIYVPINKKTNILLISSNEKLMTRPLEQTGVSKPL